MLRHFNCYQYRYFPARGVTKRCRLFWLTNSALGYEPKCGGGGGGVEGCGVSANEYSCEHGAQINFGDLILYLTYVSPAYGYIGSALVKCSNDGGPGPRYNRKEDPGSYIFGMLVVYYLHLLTSSKNQVTRRISGDPLPPSNQPGLSPPPHPLGYMLHPLQKMKERPASEKSYFGL